MGKRKHAEPENEPEPDEHEKASPGSEEEQEASEGSEGMPSDLEEESNSGSGSGSSGSEDDSSDDDSAGSSGPEVSDGPDEDESNDPDAFDKIDVNFEFFDPKESDFHGLKALLHSYLDGQQYDSSPLVEAIIAQASVGTVVRTAEDEDPIAVMTVLNTKQHSSAGYMQQIKQYMLAKCKDAAIREKLSKAWDQGSTGLLINERLINSPPQLAPPLVQALCSEIEWATEDEPTQERRDAFKFKQYLLMTRVYSDPLPAEQQQDAAGPSSSSRLPPKAAGKPPAGAPKPPKGPQVKQQQQQPSKRQKKQEAEQAPSAGPVIVYVRPEDEFFHKHATASFTFPVEGRAVAKDELQPLRLVMLLPANKMTTARAALDAVVGNIAAQ